MDIYWIIQKEQKDGPFSQHWFISPISFNLDQLEFNRVSQHSSALRPEHECNSEAFLLIMQQ